jgi:competence protein ComEA
MRRWRDGRRIWTGILALAVVLVTAGAVAAAPQSDTGGSKGPGKPVDLNSATVEQLVQIPGIGKALAERIVSFREQNGPFKRVEDLLKVQGIGEKSFQKLRPHLTVARSGS